MKNENDTNNEKITAIIKTDNSGNSLCETLESLRNIDEIIAIDCHSKDDTLDILKEYKVKTIYADKNDLLLALNQGLNEAKNNWILIVEDDEIVPQKLLNELYIYINNPKKNKNALKICQKNFYFETEIKASRKSELRLFKKGFAEFKNNFSTELILTNGKIYNFNSNYKIKNGFILKYSNNDVFKKYTQILEKNKIICRKSERKNTSIFIKPLITFLYYFIFKNAIFEGKKGFIFSFNKMIEKYILEIMLLEQNKRR